MIPVLEAQGNGGRWQVEGFGGGRKYERVGWQWNDHWWDIMLFLVLVIAYIGLILLFLPLECWIHLQINEAGKLQWMEYGFLLGTFRIWDLCLRLLLINMDQNSPKVPDIVCYCPLDRISITIIRASSPTCPVSDQMRFGYHILWLSR